MTLGHDWPRPADDDWRTKAECRTHPTDLFFPTLDQDGVGIVAKARAICARCPVSDDCLADAMAPPFEHDGIRGGMTPKERLNLRRRQQRAARLARKASA